MRFTSSEPACRKNSKGGISIWPAIPPKATSSARLGTEKSRMTLALRSAKSASGVGVGTMAFVLLRT